MNFEQTLQQMKDHGLPIPQPPIHLRIPNATQLLWEHLQAILHTQNTDPQWLPEYDKIAEWLTDNHGRGLFLFGNCGRGKSLLCRYIIPAILLQHYRFVASVFDVNQMNQDIDKVLSRRVICLDDIGTEEISIKYGERRLAFAEIIDAAEKYSKLLIVSTNLTPEQIKKRYGDRVVDRIRATTVRIPFNGKSLRK